MFTLVLNINNFKRSVVYIQIHEIKIMFIFVLIEPPSQLVNGYSVAWASAIK